ncbi:MAG: nitrate oxidoreductase subunit beta, partial [Chloroflexi bacterium]|nr:nitrate oxidoreductase subunit beta [Chloroflexota bacterium]
MPNVYNWQIGRTMTYPYPEAHPNRQFVAVFNINRCIGCQTCTGACKATWTFSCGQEYMWWNNVETKPYGSYPQHWDVKVLKLLDEAHQAAGIQPRWDRSQASEQAPYGVYNGLTLTEAAGPNDVALGYLPTDAEWRSPNFYEDTSTAYKGGAFGLSQDGAALPEHQAWFFYLMRICNHCTYPTCLAACPRKAIY